MTEEKRQNQQVCFSLSHIYSIYKLYVCVSVCCVWHSVAGPAGLSLCDARPSVTLDDS